MKYVPKAITRTVGRTVLKTQKNSPTLLFIAGVGGAVAATVLACRATLKAQHVVEHMQKDIIDVDVVRARKQVEQDEARRMEVHIWAIAAKDISKLYAPAVIVGVISMGCLTKSHRQLTQRNAALTAAYVGLQNFLEGYRGRVREALGEEKERDVYYSSTPVELIEDGPNGHKKVYGSAPGQPSPYATYFTDKNLNWQDSAEYNIHFIRIQEGILTDKLRAQGHLFLNEVYDRLGIVDDDGAMINTQTGQVCGWFVGAPNSDDFVEIRIMPIHDFQGTLMLDFNAAGNVLDMLSKGQKLNNRRKLPGRTK